MHKRGLSQFRSEFFTKQLASQLFHNFKTLMCEKQLTLYDFPKVVDVQGEMHADYIAELLELQAEQQSKYIWIVEAPNAPGKYDDYSDALVRMTWEATQHFGKRKYIAGGIGKKGSARMSSSDLAKARQKARQRARLGGSSPERQRQRRGR